MESPISLPSIIVEKPEKRIIGPPIREAGGTSEPNATNWIIQINESLESVPSDEQQYWKKRSIYTVPAYVADLNKEAYRPQVVSFGPYHHGNDHLRPMEDHKRRALLQFLRRSRKPLQPFLESVRGVAGELKASYDALDPKWKEGSGDGTEDRFLELMITDGCFMLEILRYAARQAEDEYEDRQAEDEYEDRQAEDEYEDSDPIFSKHGENYVLPFIRRDMLLLENQLPMRLLDQLIAISDGVQEDGFIINRLILNFCGGSVDNVSREKCLHVLDVFRKNMLIEPKKKDEAESQGSEEIIRSATELRENVSKEKCLHVLDVFRKNMLIEPKKKDEEESQGSEEIIRSATELRENVSKEKCLHVLDVFRRNMLIEPKKKDEAESQGSEEIIRSATELRENVSKEKCLHVLDVFRKKMLIEPKKKDEAESQGSEVKIRSATELREHGICFQKSDTNSPKNISFHGGVLRLPWIVVDGDTESMFLNLIAFERFHVGAGSEVTSYIFFMDNIIDKGQDIALLHTRGIICNVMESDEAAAKLFNSLAKGTVLDVDSSLRDVNNKVNKYCETSRHKWRANFIHTYFRTPWVILSLVAAVLLFGLTIIQTVYAVLSYNI